jgi:hypothetical protein
VRASSPAWRGRRSFTENAARQSAGKDARPAPFMLARWPCGSIPRACATRRNGSLFPKTRSRKHSPPVLATTNAMGNKRVRREVHQYAEAPERRSPSSQTSPTHEEDNHFGQEGPGERSGQHPLDAGNLNAGRRDEVGSEKVRRNASPRRTNQAGGLAKTRIARRQCRGSSAHLAGARTRWAAWREILWRPPASKGEFT